MIFFPAKLSSLEESVPGIDSESCSWLTGAEPDVVEGWYSRSASRFIVLCELECWLPLRPTWADLTIAFSRLNLNPYSATPQSIRKDFPEGNSIRVRQLMVRCSHTVGCRVWSYECVYPFPTCLNRHTVYPLGDRQYESILQWLVGHGLCV